MSTDIDLKILEVVYAIPRKKTWEYPEFLDHYYYIPSGKPRRTHEFDARPVPAFSTDMAAAYAVIEHKRREWAKLLETNPDAETGWDLIDCGSDGWRVDIIWHHHDGPMVESRGLADTLPMAICRCVLGLEVQP